jgi:hypothetical protein
MVRTTMNGWTFYQRGFILDWAIPHVPIPRPIEPAEKQD